MPFIHLNTEDEAAAIISFISVSKSPPLPPPPTVKQWSILTTDSHRCHRRRRRRHRRRCQSCTSLTTWAAHQPPGRWQIIPPTPQRPSQQQRLPSADPKARPRSSPRTLLLLRRTRKQLRKRHHRRPLPRLSLRRYRRQRHQRRSHARPTGIPGGTVRGNRRGRSALFETRSCSHTAGSPQLVDEATRTVPFTDAARKGEDLKFEQHFFNGLTIWQEEVETIYETADRTATLIVKRDAECVGTFMWELPGHDCATWPGSLTNFQSSVVDSEGSATSFLHLFAFFVQPSNQ